VKTVFIQNAQVWEKLIFENISELSLTKSFYPSAPLWPLGLNPPLISVIDNCYLRVNSTIWSLLSKMVQKGLLIILPNDQIMRTSNPNLNWQFCQDTYTYNYLYRMFRKSKPIWLRTFYTCFLCLCQLFISCYSLFKANVNQVTETRVISAHKSQ